MYTHDYELKLGDTTFNGEVEMTNAGFRSYTEGQDAKMSKNIEGAVKVILETLSKLYEDTSDFKKFEIILKP